MQGLQFVYQPDANQAAESLAERLARELAAGKRVLWLVCGGSNISLSVRVVKALPTEHLTQLHCLLTDERFGMPGHADSNWQQLLEAGFMVPGVDFQPTLTAELTLTDTCTQYGATVQAAMDAADVIIAQFGIGGDGHIAGILPRTPAVSDEQAVVGYNAGVFQRITLTPKLLRNIDAAYAFVYGDTKRDALQLLHDKQLSLEEQPSQILKQLPEAYIYTDQQLTN